MMGIADMEMKTNVVKPTPTGADNGFNRIALAGSSRRVHCSPWRSASVSFFS